MLDEPEERPHAGTPDDLSGPANVPLVIDIDGTLIRTDLLFETFWSTIANGPGHYLTLLRKLGEGKAAVKQYLAGVSDLDYANLPYDENVIALVKQVRTEGRKVYLATAGDVKHADAIAVHLGIIDGVFGSDGENNLGGRRKAARLIEAFGDKGFDYLGNGKIDLEVWKHARRALTVRLGKPHRIKLESSHDDFEHLAEEAKAGLADWLRALRVHQYAKNALIFLPLLTAQLYTVEAAVSAILAFIAFSLCASGVYLINDLVDLEADRVHLTKRNRPMASGLISIPAAMVVAPVLLIISFGIALATMPLFAAVLLGYLALTTAYSFYLKRKMVVDVVALAGLYSVRILAGAVAIDVAISEWLLAFSLFLFTALALIKRYTELAGRRDKNLSDPDNRNYKIGDLEIVAALAAAAGMNAITVFTLYLASPTVQAAYSRPALLYLVVPLLLYWFCRALLMAHRRLMDDDPVLFALKDRNSRYTGIALILIVLAAN